LFSDTCANGQGIEVDIGFVVNNEMFPLIKNCFDDNNKVTYWSQERVTAELKGYQSGVDSPSFIQDDFYPGWDVDQLHTFSNQQSVFQKLLGSTKYLSQSGDLFLARGK